MATTGKYSRNGNMMVLLMILILLCNMRHIFVRITPNRFLLIRRLGNQSNLVNRKRIHFQVARDQILQNQLSPIKFLFKIVIPYKEIDIIQINRRYPCKSFTEKPFATTTIEPTTATTITMDTTTSATTTFKAGCSTDRWRSLNPNFEATEQDDQSILVNCKSGYKLNILDGRERTKGICEGSEYVFKYNNVRCTKCPEFVQQGANGVGLLNTIKWSNGISVIFRIEIQKNDPNFLIGMKFLNFSRVYLYFISVGD